MKQNSKPILRAQVGRVKLSKELRQYVDKILAQIPPEALLIEEMYRKRQQQKTKLEEWQTQQ